MGGIDFYKIATSLTERQVYLKWWRDDCYVCNMLELESVLQLDAFLLQASKGYSGTQPNTVPNQPPFNKPVDMRGENELGMEYDYFGSEKKRYFSFHNNGCASKVSFKQQQELIQYVQGSHPKLDSYPDMKQRRAELWRERATGNEVGDDYQKKELPIIANWFAKCWDCSADDLHSVKRETPSIWILPGTPQSRIVKSL
jgi:hypothetical protein